MKIHRKNEQGFSYIDVMIAIVILMVGVLAMLSALTANLIRSYESEKRIVAKQLALSSLESIMSGKEISRTDVIPSFDALRNVGSPTVNGVDGIFLTGFNPIRDDEGIDGIAGTADDACAQGGPCTDGTYTNTSTVKTGYRAGSDHYRHQRSRTADLFWLPDHDSPRRGAYQVLCQSIAPRRDRFDQYHQLLELSRREVNKNEILFETQDHS